jgi:uncharacterized protein
VAQIAMLTPLLVLGLAIVVSFLGSLGGLGGAVLLVPALVLLGWSPIEAAPLGMAMVAANSLAAVPRQLRHSIANHRIGVTLETAASVGAVAGALLALVFTPRVLLFVLGGAAMLSALAGGTRTGQRNLPVEGVAFTDVRDQPGRLASAYIDQAGRVVPYAPRRVGAGLMLFGVAGVVAGMTGSSGGYIKTPVMSEVMQVPVKVAAATTVFMVGVTAAVSLAVYASQGRPTSAIAPAVVGGLVGGRLGAAAQPRLPAPLVRQVLSIVLAVIGLIVVVTA